MKPFPVALRCRPSVLLLLLLLWPLPSTAQLRPLEPFDYRVFQSGATLVADIGVGFHNDQLASLAGVRGDLTEYGNFHAAWRSGPIAIEIGGTAYRVFRNESVFAPPFGDARAPDGDARTDAGDIRVGTVVQLTSLNRPYGAALRFGTRLPTTDNQVGLDRDRTDFYALLAGRAQRGALSATTEIGLGINGTHNLEFEQVDVLLYNVAAEYRMGRFTPIGMILGRMDGMEWDFRGNENVGEVRIGARYGVDYWIQGMFVRGFEEFSPSTGLLISAGLLR